MEANFGSGPVSEPGLLVKLENGVPKSPGSTEGRRGGLCLIRLTCRNGVEEFQTCNFKVLTVVARPDSSHHPLDSCHDLALPKFYNEVSKAITSPSLQRTIEGV